MDLGPIAPPIAQRHTDALKRRDNSARRSLLRPQTVLGMAAAVMTAVVVLSASFTITNIPADFLGKGTAWFWGLAGLTSLVGTGSWFLRRSPVAHKPDSFEEVRLACAQNDPLAVFAAHTRWLATLEVELDDTEYEALFAPFQEWEEMQLATEDCDPTWSADRLLKVLEAQRADLLNPAKNRTQASAGDGGSMLRA